MKLCLIIFSILISLICIDTEVTFRCDYKFSNLTNGWLKYHEIPASWQDAFLKCAAEGAMLASPTSPNMLSKMLQIMKPVLLRQQVLFTGLHSTFSKGEYYTVDGIMLTQFHHVWADSQPNNLDDDEACLTLNVMGELSDTNCKKTHPYICFKHYDPKTVTNECGTTDSGYTLDSRTNSCYKFHSEARNFSRAHFVCSAEGGHLAIINSELEALVIKNLYAKYPSAASVAFIGFHNWNERGEWRTIHGQTLEEAGFSKFDKNQPDYSSPGEFCGSIFRNGLLNDLWCDKFSPFICEKDPKFPKVCTRTNMEFVDVQPIVETWQPTSDS